MTGAVVGSEARRAHDFLAPALFALVAAVRRAQGRVLAARTPAADPEAIHDFRVALRRLRTALRTGRAVFGRGRMRAIGASLRGFAQATGALRDEEALRETLLALPVSGRTRSALEAWLEKRARQERARRRVVAALLRRPDGPDGPSLATALAHLERRLGRPRSTDLLLDQLAREATRAAHAGVLELAPAPATDAAAMHALRIQWKRLRYTADLLAGPLGEGAAVLAKSAARMQKRLGLLHDLDEALLRVARARGLPERPAAALRRALLRARREAAARARRDQPAALATIRPLIPAPP